MCIEHYLWAAATIDTKLTSHTVKVGVHLSQGNSLPLMIGWVIRLCYFIASHWTLFMSVTVVSRVVTDEYGKNKNNPCKQPSWVSTVCPGRRGKENIDWNRSRKTQPQIKDTRQNNLHLEDFFWNTVCFPTSLFLPHFTFVRVKEIGHRKPAS